MSIKSIDQKFTSANSVPVERAVVTREEWEAVKGITEGLAEGIRWLEAAGYGDSADFKDQMSARSKARNALAQYKEAKQ